MSVQYPYDSHYKGIFFIFNNRSKTVRKSVVSILCVSMFILWVGSAAASTKYDIFNVEGIRVNDNSTVKGHLELVTNTEGKNYVVVGVIVNREGELDRVTGNYIENGMYRVVGKTFIYEVNKRD